MLARIRLTNKGDLLRVGLFGTASVERSALGPVEARLVVPREALDEVDGQAVVFVHDDSKAGTFELRHVVIGRASTRKVEIENGVREGESVVVGGIFTIKSAFLKSTIGHEH